MSSMDGHRDNHTTLHRLASSTLAAAAAAASYMSYEAHWVECCQKDLLVPGLPAEWSGLTVLHLSDVHAGSFSVNEHSLGKVVGWAAKLAVDLVLLTGDVLGKPDQSQACLRLLSRLRPSLGMFAVTGNHEYGVSKAPFARPLSTAHLWHDLGATLLVDSCATLPARGKSSVRLFGADYLTGGYDLLDSGMATAAQEPGVFPILLIHEPPQADSPLAQAFPLAFAGHTHGGQLRLPGPSGLTALHKERFEHLAGVHPWGQGTIVISRGVGVSFLPLRLLTRPEATLWRLLYTSA